MAIHKKLLAIGDNQSGKTHLLFCISGRNLFNASYTPTIFDNYTLNLKVDNKLVMLSLWDRATMTHSAHYPTQILM